MMLLILSPQKTLHFLYSYKFYLSENVFLPSNTLWMSMKILRTACCRPVKRYVYCCCHTVQFKLYYEVQCILTEIEKGKVYSRQCSWTPGRVIPALSSGCSFYMIMAHIPPKSGFNKWLLTFYRTYDLISPFSRISASYVVLWIPKLHGFCDLKTTPHVPPIHG